VREEGREGARRLTGVAVGVRAWAARAAGAMRRKPRVEMEKGVDKET